MWPEWSREAEERVKEGLQKVWDWSCQSNHRGSVKGWDEGRWVADVIPVGMQQITRTLAVGLALRWFLVVFRVESGRLKI